MAALARREDSVVAALGELKGLEESRRKQEAVAAQRALDAQLARERDAAAERKRIADETERRIAEEARQVSVRAEAEARAERLVAIEAEARAKASAEIAVQASLAAERQTHELALKRELALRAKPRGLIALCGVLTLAVIALVAVVVQRGIALDDARRDGAAVASELAGMRTRVDKLEAQADQDRATIAALQLNQRPAATQPPVAPTPAAPTGKGSGKGGHGGHGGHGGGTTNGGNDGVDVRQKCIDLPLGCPDDEK